MRRQLALGWLHQSVYLQCRFAPWLVGACCLVQIPAQRYQRARPTPKYKVEPPLCNVTGEFRYLDARETCRSGHTETGVRRR